MRVITVSELRLLNRAQLFSLRVQMQAVLADLPEGSTEYEFVRATLENIRHVMAWSTSLFETPACYFRPESIRL